MTTHNAAKGLAQAPPPMPTRRTVDAFTRLCHLLLALSFAGAYLTAESEVFRRVHVALGYTLGGLLGVRMVWGFFGPRQVRWSGFRGKLLGLKPWLQGLAQGRLAGQLAQNLYLALSVAAVLLAIAPVVLTGHVMDQEWTGGWISDVHEFFGNAMLLAVLAHIAGVVLLSLLRKRNLALPMLTGRIPGVGPDLIRSNHSLLAVLLLCAVVSFWGWQWLSKSQVAAHVGLEAPPDAIVVTRAQSESDADGD